MLGFFFLPHLWIFTWFISSSSPKLLFSLSWSLSVPISSSQADPDTFEYLYFTIVKRRFLIKHHFECKDALEGALRSPLSSILFFVCGGSWCPIWCLCGLEGAPRISKTFYFGTLEPPRLRKNNFSSQTKHVQKLRFHRRQIAVFEGGGTEIKDF